jgi:hypothetical protein
MVIIVRRRTEGASPIPLDGVLGYLWGQENGGEKERKGRGKKKQTERWKINGRRVIERFTEERKEELSKRGRREGTGQGEAMKE